MATRAFFVDYCTFSLKTLPNCKLYKKKYYQFFSLTHTRFISATVVLFSATINSLRLHFVYDRIGWYFLDEDVRSEKKFFTMYT